MLEDLRVVSFVNYLLPDGTDPRQLPAAEARAAFGGTVAPVLDLTLDPRTTHAASRSSSVLVPETADPVDAG
ncbi:hypothetical protein GCM10022245_22480 [Streptomyces mayteni]